jgi:hypothetical protein
MFLCSKCHKFATCDHRTGSVGRCEGCGETAPCVDCRVHPIGDVRLYSTSPTINFRLGPRQTPRVLTHIGEFFSMYGMPGLPDHDPEHCERIGAGLLGGTYRLQARAL